MSVKDIRPYFDEILKARKYKEHADGFAIDNVPSTLLDRAYHVYFPSIVGEAGAQTLGQMDVRVALRTFYKGFRNPKAAIDLALSETEAIAKALTETARRTDQPGILNVVYGSTDFAPLGETNDSVVFVESSYTVRVLVA